MFNQTAIIENAHKLWKQLTFLKKSLYFIRENINILFSDLFFFQIWIRNFFFFVVETTKSVRKILIEMTKLNKKK